MSKKLDQNLQLEIINQQKRPSEELCYSISSQLVDQFPSVEQDQMVQVVFDNKNINSLIKSILKQKKQNEQNNINIVNNMDQNVQQKVPKRFNENNEISSIDQYFIDKERSIDQEFSDNISHNKLLFDISLQLKEMFPEVAEREIIQFIQLSTNSDELQRQLEDSNDSNSKEVQERNIHFPKWKINDNNLIQEEKENRIVKHLSSKFLEADEDSIRQLYRRNGFSQDSTQEYLSKNQNEFSFNQIPNQKLEQKKFDDQSNRNDDVKNQEISDIFGKIKNQSSEIKKFAQFNSIPELSRIKDNLMSEIQMLRSNNQFDKKSQRMAFKFDLQTLHRLHNLCSQILLCNTFQSNNNDLNNLREVDLHHLTVNDALSILSQCVGSVKTFIEDRRIPDGWKVKVITGEGRHSQQGVSQLKIDIKQFLDNRKIRQKEQNQQIEVNIWLGE